MKPISTIHVAEEHTMSTPLNETQTSPSNSNSLNISFEDDEVKWSAITQRNPLASGMFLYGVTTTKIFCRPICPARLPRRANVVFFFSLTAAEQAGFRACLRCRPDSESSSITSTRASIVTKACHSIVTRTKISLDELATESKLSKFHFQRTFKSITGITPQQYKMAHQHSKKQLVPEKVVFAVGPCYLGHILVAVSTRGICAIQLGDDPDILITSLHSRYPNAEICGDSPDFDNIVSILAGAAESSRIAEWELPLDVQGTAFQCRVWNGLRGIPWGELRSYKDIARDIGTPEAVRAVANACAANPLAIAIPCHRVVRTGGGLGGYRWGIDRKKVLCEGESREGVDSEGIEELKKWVESCLNSC
jgi:AraC family transcriptional regulator, regulatory protein of adaptative response / methylated-DNA-[protein]-cysteine methyltransferase